MANIQTEGSTTDLMPEVRSGALSSGSLSLIRRLFNSSPFPLAFVEGSKLLFAFANDAFCRVAGSSNEELAGKHFPDILNTNENCTAILERIYKTGQSELFQASELSQSTSGNLSYVMWPVLGDDNLPAGVMIQIDEMTTFRTQAADMNQSLLLAGIRQHEQTEAAERQTAQLQLEIQERKVAEQRLAEQAAFLDNANDAIIVRDMKHLVTYWNQAAERLYGWTAAEAKGSLLHELVLVDTPSIRNVVNAVLETGEWKGILDKTAKNGTVLTVQGSWTLLRDPAGMPKSILTIDTDITERKQLEEQLMQSQKMEVVGRLAGGIAHDFNNLLSAIMGYTEFVMDEVEKDSSAYADLQQIRKAGERAASLTGQLLSFARKQIADPQVTNLNDLILNTDKLLRRLIGEDIELVTLADINLTRVKVDPGQFEQVMVNLAVNARDAMPKGGKLILATEQVVLGQEHTLHFGALPPGPYVVFSMSDNGIGMDEHTLSHAFEPFFTTKGVGKGTGLGLATCYGIVQQSGGIIRVESTPGKGTTFRIYFPSVNEAEKLHSNVERTSGHLRGTETVLVVEDEPMVREIVVRALGGQGYKLLLATNGGEALRLVSEHVGKIDLLVTDVVMPHMGGKELADKLAVLRPETKVLYVSGYTEDAIAHRGVLQEGLSFLAKPFTPVSLARKVRLVLDTP